MVTDEKIEFLTARLDELEELYRPGDFIEVDSARGPGWGCRYYPICGEFTWEGTKTSTEAAEGTVKSILWVAPIYTLLTIGSWMLVAWCFATGYVAEGVSSAVMAIICTLFNVQMVKDLIQYIRETS